MLNFIWNWILSYFTKDKVGAIIRTLLLKAGAKVVKEIMKPANQKKALELVKALKARKELSSEAKAKEFDLQMRAWLKMTKNEVISQAEMNCLREMAVVAMKGEEEEDAAEEV